MQWLTADIVFDGYDFHANFFIQVNETGEIIAIQREEPAAEVKRLNGLLMPGMINAHCHLELSHTKSLIPEKTGLSTFLQNVSEQIPQKVADETIQKAQLAADTEMVNNGIVAVGDICNTTKSIALKQKSKIHYHNFVECIAIRATDSVKRFADYKKVYDAFQVVDLASSLSLHTPYTCNEGMYDLVNGQSSFVSIHNQESEAENVLFERKEGDFDNFYKHFDLDKSEIIREQTSLSSFENSQRLLSGDTKKLFVHNTFTRKEDLQFAEENTWFCFCPKANLYIENQLPNIPIFSDFQDRIVLGTDSLASNDALNILSEVKTIQDHFPGIPLKNILQWATSNGARLFGLDDKFGSFEIGRRPSFLVAKDFNIESKRLLGEGIQLL